MAVVHRRARTARLADSRDRRALPSLARFMETIIVMSKVLCATDLSEHGGDVLRVAAAMAKALNEPLEVLHVLEPPLVPGGEAGAALLASLREAAQVELRRHLDALTASGVSVSGWSELGRADESILTAADGGKASLLVLGTHGRSPAARAMVGSVAERIMRKAPCPVLVVPPLPSSALARWNPATRRLRLTVGLDGELSQETLLAWVRDLRLHIPCDVSVVHLYWPPRESRRLGLPVEGAGGPDRGIVACLENELRPRVGTLPGTGTLDLHVCPNWGEASAALVDRTTHDQADLLVVGTSVGGGSSTAIGALRDGRTPVVCVPVPASRAHASTARATGRHVAVFTDLADDGIAAFSEATWLLQGEGLVTVCHVRTPEKDGRDRATPDEIEARLQALSTPVCGGAKIEVRTLVHESPSAAEGIAQTIARIRPDVVILCSRMTPGSQGSALGATADVVVRHCPVPVVIVAPHAGPGAAVGPAATAARNLNM